MTTYETWFLGGDPGWDWAGHPTLTHSFDPTDVPPGAPTGAHALLIQQTSAAAAFSHTDPEWIYQSLTPNFTLGPGSGLTEVPLWIKYESPNAVYEFVGIRVGLYNVTGDYLYGGFNIYAEQPWTQHFITVPVSGTATEYRWILFADSLFAVEAVGYVGVSSLRFAGLYSGDEVTAGPRVLPPLRRIQRGDGLAVGGVPRAVTSRSRQSSLRRGTAFS